jgi:hypothetical protein
MVNAAFNVRHGNRLHQLQGSRTLRIRKHGKANKEASKQTNEQAVRFHFTSLDVIRF